ncbi:Beta-cyclopiazonate dehydrogenase [Cyphellophora attinorum]|uniref:Beta-cyclopiazonate dehydrogenase n=1 Tax=Cyphellophora attinorum TaxID=1664694 RepID=A0A0N1HNE6_9EURO|nr:Beta-cyclopiazonate dehydrogenase [Phialophora attinorum]KPI36560.1 Beta-cyclopiazonate dehydrogenase [Phialophora attinorum]
MKQLSTAFLALAASQLVRTAAVPSCHEELSPDKEWTPVTGPQTPPSPPIPGPAGVSKPPAGPGGPPTGPGKPDEGPHPPDHPEGSSKECDVVVLGGGASGSYIATELYLQKYTVCIVEKRGVLGGTVNTYKVPETGKTVDFGVINWLALPEMVEYFEQLGVETIPTPYQIPPQVVVDFATGQQLNSTGMAWVEYWAGVVQDLGEKWAYSWPDSPTLPKDLTLPAPDYMIKHNITDMAELIRFDIPSKATADIPMAYQLKYFDWYDAFASNIPYVTTHDLNNQDVYNRVAKLVGADNVFFNSEAVRIARSAVPGGHPEKSKSPVQLEVKTSDKTTTINAKAMVLAYLPQPDGLSAFDFDPSERDIFSSFRVNIIYTGIVSQSGLPQGSFYSNTNAKDPLGNPPYPYFYVASGRILSDAEVHKTLFDGVATLKKSLGVTTNSTQKPVIKALELHPQLEPHVSGEKIEAGFYKKLNGLQGAKSTWYVGNYIAGLRTAEVVKHAHDLVLPELLEYLKAENTSASVEIAVIANSTISGISRVRRSRSLDSTVTIDLNPTTTAAWHDFPKRLPPVDTTFTTDLTPTTSAAWHNFP